MADTYFTPISDADGLLEGRPAEFRASPVTGGPWSPDQQHGGPPNALAVAVAERAVHEATHRDDLAAVRLAADFLGPVPVGELALTARIVRAGRSAALAEVTVATGTRDCLHCRVWFVRGTDTSAAAPGPQRVPVVGDGAGAAIDFPYGRTLEWRFVTGAMDRPGPAAVWARPRIELLPGHTMSSLSRAVLIADSASGISAELSWDEWSFANIDLDVHLARPMAGEWMHMAGRTLLGHHGWAVARSELSDEAGPLGGGLQTLVLSPRTQRE